MISCTKLDEKLNSTVTNDQAAQALGSNGVALLLQAAYNDIGGPFTSQDLVFAMQSVTADEAVVPTRGGDWDDNGAWRVLHNHSWDANHTYFLNVFNSLNKINFDATNVLAFNPSKQQAAEARFIRAFALYNILDLYGQVPFRNPGDNLLNAPEVKSGGDAASFIISELNEIIADLPTTNTPGKATQNAGKALLMRCYLNKGAWANRTAPTFADADMQQVITLGNSIVSSGTYSLASEYFTNFDVYNGNSPENIFTVINNSGATTNTSDIRARWTMTLHYNQYTPTNPNSGWNGFATVSDFYNSFGTTAAPMVGVSQFAAGNTSGKYADTSKDSRIGGRYYVGVTDASGMKPGFMIGQQYTETGVAEKDRKGNPLAFNPVIASDLKETGSNLEVTGIRVIKYPPDFTENGKYFQNLAGNDLVLIRYADVLLMLAEAKLRIASADNAGALALVNQVRTARKAAPLTTISLVNTSNIYDPNTLLCERGREFYWEALRRTDLIRFGVFTKAWQYKPTSDAKYLLFPIPTQALAANPNLVQNPGY